MSVRLHFVVEGQTEEAFVNRVLRPHLANFEVWADVRCVYTSRQGPFWVRGGMTSYDRAKGDIDRWLKQDRGADVRLTTMFDFYRLPKDFPGWTESAKVPEAQVRVEHIEKEFAAKIADSRFIPYIQMHEFEALIFVDVTRLALLYPGPERTQAIETLRAESQHQGNPETINLDRPPSKRIRECIPDYEKVIAGVLVVQEIGLSRIRDVCTHFSSWLTQLENLSR